MENNFKLFHQCNFAGVVWTIVFIKNNYVHLTSLDGKQHKQYIDISIITSARRTSKEICERIVADGNCDFIEDCEDCPLDQQCPGFCGEIETILARRWLEELK